jgi:hypothetical protein
MRTETTRLFTCKVASDTGSAPNPYFGVCTLALSVPRIRQKRSRRSRRGLRLPIGGRS